jgi:hypothetical protein
MDTMQTKKTGTLRQAQGERPGVASEAAAQAALRRGPTRELAPDEERVLRMRLGASPPHAAPLERAAELPGRWEPSTGGVRAAPGQRTDLEIELLAFEIEAHLRLRERQATGDAARATQTRTIPQPSRTKEKIVRALRKKV